MSEKNKITKFLIKSVSIFIKTAIIAISITYGSIVAVLSIPEFLKNIKKCTFGENLNPELVKAASHRLKNFEGKHFFIKASDGIKLHVFIRKHGGNVKGLPSTTNVAPRRVLGVGKLGKVIFHRATELKF